MAYTREQIKAKLREFYEKYGYLPGKKDLCPPPDGMPWYQVICSKCGRFETVLQEAFEDCNYSNLRQQTRMRRQKQHRQDMRELLKQEYWDETLRLGYPPTIDQVDANPSMHSKSAYSNYWGMKNLLKELDLEKSYRRPRGDGHEYTKDYILRLLKGKYRRDGVVPTMRSVNEDYRLPSAQVYTDRFGLSWDQILSLAGIPPLKKNAAHAGLTDEELLKRLRDLSRRLLHTPTKREVNQSLVTPRSETYVKRFGSFYDALILAGLKPTGRQKRSHNGNQNRQAHAKTQPE